MTKEQDKIDQLLSKLKSMMQRQDAFAKEVNELRDEINQLKSYSVENVQGKELQSKEELQDDSTVESEHEEITERAKTNQQTVKQERVNVSPQVSNKPQVKSNIEKFIGENLINKVGIAITVIGVAIGAKYSIEHELISPLTRIILGYLSGIALLGFGMKLKKKYENYSAVLVSGAMAVMYFITYAAYSFYGLIPQIFTFGLMAVFTAFTVVAAINYNKQVIAHIGLVGAYAVPFLLSESTGNVMILFSYVAIINIGILVIAFKKYWKALYYSSFLMTWIIYLLWFWSSYVLAEDFGFALSFLTIFFSIFYLMFVAYKLTKSIKYEFIDVALLLSNSFVFYGIGYSIISDHSTGEQLLGLFTLCNAIVHSMVSVIVYRQKLADKNLFYLISGLVLVFITIAIPVQLDGSWVTLLWITEAALLFWIGRTKKVSIYEILSYPLVLLALISILHDWALIYYNYYPENPEAHLSPFFNITFLSSLLFIASLGFITVLNFNKKYTNALHNKRGLFRFVSAAIPAILLFVLYYAFRLEISTYFKQLYIDSEIATQSDNYPFDDYFRNIDIKRFKTIWILNYSLLFFSILSFVNFRKIKNRLLGFVNMGMNTLVIAIFLTQGLYVLSELRISYLEQTLTEYYDAGVFHITIRYVSFIFVSIMLFACYKYSRQDFMNRSFKVAYDFLLYISILWIVSSELINLLDIAGSAESYKLGLSILWGTYSLFLIVLGIWKKKKYLRVMAISLFGVTLVKLFFYDISHLNTIAKTIVFVSLGILLLIISFLYNKYKQIIYDEPEN